MSVGKLDAPRATSAGSILTHVQQLLEMRVIGPDP
jgi:hypothetical protein